MHKSQRWLRNVIGILLAVFALGTYTPASAAEASAPGKPAIVEIVELKGIISDVTAASMARMAENIKENKRIKALLLVVNTPGGGAVASAAVYEELSKLEIPVVGWCDSVCASGGMYVLMAPSVKHIGMRTETIAGSIGVVMNVTRFNRLLDWLRIDNQTFVSGHLKDSGSPVRPGNDADTAYLQSIIGDLAKNFYGVVGKSRKITNWSAVKTGRIFIGEQNVAVGLADSVMTKEQAIAKAKELSGEKLIFTRDEMKKMSEAAHESTLYLNPPVQPMTQFGDLPALIEIVKEIRAGESVRFEYLMPYHF